MEALENLLIVFFCLSKVNCHQEKSRYAIISSIQGIIQNVSQQRTLKDAGSFYWTVQRRLPEFLQLDKAPIVEIGCKF
jgi:hypothetical protein